MKVTSILLAALLMAAFVPLKAQEEEDPFATTYSFLNADEDLELSSVPGNILLGYVNTHGVGETDKHLILAMFFQKGTINGDQIYFITKPVHGLRYEFKGKLARGTAKVPTEEGYYQITGKLTELLADEEGKVTARDREVTFKSMPADSPERPVARTENASSL